MTRVRTTAPPVKSRTTGDSTPARPFTAARSVTSTAARPRRWLTRPDPMPLSTDTPTVLWTLRNGHRHLARRPDAIQRYNRPTLLLEQPMALPSGTRLGSYMKSLP